MNKDAFYEVALDDKGPIHLQWVGIIMSTFEKLKENIRQLEACNTDDSTRLIRELQSLFHQAHATLEKASSNPKNSPFIILYKQCAVDIAQRLWDVESIYKRKARNSSLQRIKMVCPDMDDETASSLLDAKRPLIPDPAAQRYLERKQQEALELEHLVQTTHQLFNPVNLIVDAHTDTLTSIEMHFYQAAPKLEEGDARQDMSHTSLLSIILVSLCLVFILSIVIVVYLLK
jgi:hypothetical protein